MEIGHRLEGRTIEVMWKVANTDSGEMLFMMGGHPAFQVPEGKTYADFTFEFNRRGCREGQFTDCLHYLAPNANGYEKGRTSGKFEAVRGPVPLTKEDFSIQLLHICLMKHKSAAKSLMVDGSPYVTLECSDFHIWEYGQWRPPIPLYVWNHGTVSAHQMDIRGIEGQKGNHIVADGKTGRRATRSGWNNNECHVRMRGEIQLRTRVYITRRRTMYKIVKSECLAIRYNLMEEAPRIIRACQPGEL